MTNLSRSARPRNRTANFEAKPMPLSIFWSFSVLAWTFAIATMTFAQDADPLCKSSIDTRIWTQSNDLTIGGSNAHLALMMSNFSEMDDGSSDASKSLVGAYPSKLNDPRTQQTVDLEPVSEVNIGGSKIRVPLKPAEVNKCSKAIRSFQSKIVDLTDRSYICSLLEVDRSCLTNSESQPHVKDVSIPFRSVAIIVLGQQSICTGLLLNEYSFKTARHCFVDQTSGNLLPEFSNLSATDLKIETLDGNRQISINAGQIKKLIVPHGFDIDQDPVTIGVTVRASLGAKPLPQVKLTLPTNNQLLWLVGPVPLLDKAVALQHAALNPTASPPAVNWRDSIRWSSSLGAQCRTVEIEGSCVYHSCQSFQGFSGSPMIVKVTPGTGGAPDTIEYAGIHSGTPGKEKPFGWPGCTKSTPDFLASDYLIFNVGRAGD